MIRLDDEPDAPDQPDVPEPMGPDVKEPGDNRTLNSPINELESRLFRQRKVLVFGAINDKVARDVTGRLLALASEGSDPIDVYINSPGGHVESGDTIHDMIRFVDADVTVRVIGTGWVASAGALIFLAGRKEHRLCLPNTRFLLHQPMGGGARPGDRHRHRGARDHQDARADQPDDRPRNRPGLRPHRQRHRPQLLDERGGSHRVRSRQPRDQQRQGFLTPVTRTNALPLAAASGRGLFSGRW